MRILFVGDVVGSPGRGMIQQYVPALKKKYTPTVTIINGENAAGGRGITEKIYRNFFRMRSTSGYQITLGITVKYLNLLMMQNILQDQLTSQKELRKRAYFCEL